VLLIALALAVLPADDSVPLPDLAACHAPLETSAGGWLLRDFAATGSGSGSASPATRLRSLRIGEPCTQDDAPDGALILPLTFSEVPVTGTAVAGIAGGSNVCRSDSGGTDCMQFLGMAYWSLGGRNVQCWKYTDISGYWTALRTGGHASFTSANLNFYWSTFGGSSVCAGFGTANGFLDESWTPTSYYSGGFGSPGSPTGGIGSGIPTFAGKQSGKLEVGGGTVFAPASTVSTVITCAPRFDSPGTDQFQIFSTSILVSDGVENYLPTDLTAGTGWTRTANVNLFGSGATVATCPTLVYFDLSVCVYVLPNGVTDKSCTLTRWEASLYQRSHNYGDGVGTPPVWLCTLDSTQQGCYPILHPPVIDGSSPAVCDGAPSILEAGAFVLHYARCLFVPVNGWDRLGLFGDAWESSSVGGVTEALSALPTAFSFAETCGTLIDASDLEQFPIVVSSCSWLPYSAPIKLIVGLLLTAGFAFWYVPLVVSIVTSPATKKLPVPLRMDESDNGWLA
jgi:hypothetical protein